MTEPPKKARNPNARAVFAANKSRIGEMLSNDRLMTEIFAELQFPGSYTQFTRYCAKAFKPSPTAPALMPVAVAATSTTPPQKAPAQPLSLREPIRAPDTAPRRRWDPANIDEAELLKQRIEE